MPAERGGPTVTYFSTNTGGRGAMTTASGSLQDLRRRIYVKAKAEKTWRFWGLYVHVAKLETLRAAYDIAKRDVKDYLPEGVDKFGLGSNIWGFGLTWSTRNVAPD